MTAKNVTVRIHSTRTEAVQLTEAPYGGWTVTLAGTVLGTVDSYTGSLDRRSGNLRIPGKQRTLWSCKAVQVEGGQRTRSEFDFPGRADAIRSLIRTADLRARVARGEFR